MCRVRQRAASTAVAALCIPVSRTTSLSLSRKRPKRSWTSDRNVVCCFLYCMRILHCTRVVRHIGVCRRLLLSRPLLSLSLILTSSLYPSIALFPHPTLPRPFRLSDIPPPACPLKYLHKNPLSPFSLSFSRALAHARGLCFCLSLHPPIPPIPQCAALRCNLKAKRMMNQRANPRRVSSCFFVQAS